jgi:hypothetical protein
MGEKVVAMQTIIINNVYSLFITLLCYACPFVGSTGMSAHSCAHLTRYSRSHFTKLLKRSTCQIEEISEDPLQLRDGFLHSFKEVTCVSNARSLFRNARNSDLCCVRRRRTITTTSWDS